MNIAIFLTISCILICALIIFITAKKIKILEKEEQRCLNNLNRLKEDELDVLQNMNLACDQRRQAEIETEVLKNSAIQLKEQADKSAEAYYEEKMNTTKLQLEKDLQKEQEKFQQAKEEYLAEYENTMADMAKEMSSYGINARQLIMTIDDLKSKARAAIEAQKRNMQEKDTMDFHRIQISDADLLEIKKLREVLPYLRDKDALNKVIYKIYYENPTNDLIGRVIGQKQGGIYKITNINNGMCYVGQAVNFANRWKQHIKRGVGAEPITHNKLYPAMQKEGVENFTFEVIEECPSDKLNEREAYWQNYFGAKEFGYSMR